MTKTPFSAPQQAGIPGILCRLICGIYEALLLVGVIAAAVVFPQMLYAMVANQTAPHWLMQYHLLAILAFYFTWFWRHGGQTLAMKTWKIRLENVRNDEAITLTQCLLRFALCWPSWLCFGAGIFWALFDREQQFLHDRIAGTRLVNASANAVSH